MKSVVKVFAKPNQQFDASLYIQKIESWSITILYFNFIIKLHIYAYKYIYPILLSISVYTLFIHTIFIHFIVQRMAILQSKSPNILTNYNLYDGDDNIYYVRPYLQQTLQQRLQLNYYHSFIIIWLYLFHFHFRQEMSLEEKMWIVYQLIKAVDQLYKQNVLVTRFTYI